MGSLLSYSGLSTKIRAMQSKLITEEQLQEIVRLSGVPQVAAYLKRTPGYSRIWASLDENDLHRGQIEKFLKASVFENFSRLYHFANKEQRKFLELYSKRYEILVLKELLTNLFDNRDLNSVDVSPYQDFFKIHSNIDFEALASCTNMAEFLKGLEQSEYHAPLARIYEHGGALLFDYGMALDLYCFTQVWNVRSKLFRGKDLETITLTCGEDFDLLNLQFIQRSKRYFHMEPADIYALLIPVNYKLKKEEIRGLVEAATEDDYQKIFRNTCYGKKYEKLGLHNLEEFYNVILRDTLEKEARESPYSIAILYSYLYHKEQEVNRLTIAVECVRYGVVPDEAMQYIYNT